MKKLTKLICIALVLSMLIALVPTLSAQEIIYNCGDYEYKLKEDGTATITKIKSSDAYIIIPEELDGHTVSGYSWNMPRNSTFRYVSIPEGVTSVPLEPFYHAKVIRIPTTAKDISEAGGETETTVVISVGERSIRGAAWYDNYISIKTVYYEGSEEQFLEDIKFYRPQVPDADSGAKGFLSDGRTVHYNCAPKDKFTDISEDAWYYDYLYSAYREKLMVGTSDTEFSPNAMMTRAMMAVALWRISGEPETSGEEPFKDVGDTWYTSAVKWAYESGIMEGVSSTEFSPDATLTREQMATTLYRYAATSGVHASYAGEISAFPDGDEISSWAAEALAWATGEKIISGSKTEDGAVLLAPKGEVTRAQLAKVLAVFYYSFVA